MFNPDKLRDYARMMRHAIHVGGFKTNSANEKELLLEAMDRVRRLSHQNGTPQITLWPGELNDAARLSASTIYWQYMDVDARTITARDQNDWERINRLCHEINLLHLNMLNEDFDKGIAIRVAELKEISNLTPKNIPTKRDQNYTAILACLGHSERIIRPAKVFPGFVRPTVTLGVYGSPEELEAARALLTPPARLMSEVDDDLDFAKLLESAVANWMNVRYPGKPLLSYRPGTPEQTAKLAYYLHCHVVQVPDDQAPPWHLVNEAYRSAMEMMVEESYRWVQSGHTGPPSYATVRAINQLSGLPQPWSNNIVDNLGARAMVVAAMTLPPIDKLYATYH